MGELSAYGAMNKEEKDMKKREPWRIVVGICGVIVIVLLWIF